MTDEVWKKIPDMPWYYEVSNLGRVKSLSRTSRRGWNIRERLLKYSDGKISLTLENGTEKCYYVARLVLTAFVGPPPPNKPISRHLDDVRQNNALENLAWGDDHQNRQDALRNGRTYINTKPRKEHSKATKEKIRQTLMGVPTGRKITPKHRAALIEGRRKFYERKRHNIAP